MSGAGAGGTPPRDLLDAAALDGPDALGREMAEGPAAVAETLAHVARLRPALDASVASAGRIVLVGTGASLAVARTAAPLWRQRAAATRPAATVRVLDVVVREASAAVLGDVDGQPFRRDDLVVAVSQSGTSPETLAAARRARAAGSAVLAVTAQLDSPLATAASLTLPIASGEERDASTKSALATLAGLLAVGRVLPEGAAGNAAVVRLRAVVGSMEIAVSAGRLLAAADRVWFLGFGAAHGLAEAGALLWHEKVVRPAVATTPSEFRHGLIEASRAGDAVVLLDVDAPDARRTAYLGRLRDELAALDVAIVEVAPAPLAAPAPAAEPGPEAGRRLRIEIASKEPAARALETLLRVQQVARAAALAAGTYRDGFEILRRVVTAADDLFR
ncbi:MAG TPA: SIS domain-containing protein [Candidatus Limnocylindrales bacterium]